MILYQIGGKRVCCEPINQGRDTYLIIETKVKGLTTVFKNKEWVIQDAITIPTKALENYARMKTSTEPK